MKANKDLSLSQDKVAPLSEEEKNKARLTFNLYDYDTSGTICASELADLLTEMDLPIGVGHCTKLLKDHGISTGGSTAELEIDFDQFTQVYRILVANQPSATRKKNARPSDRVGFEDVYFNERNLRTAFEYYDADASGQLDSEELAAILADLGFEDMYQDNFGTMIEQTLTAVGTSLDKDGNALLDFHQFIVFINEVIEYLHACNTVEETYY